MTPSALLVAVLIAGVLTGIQAPTNALLTKAMGTPLGSALVSFAVGTAALALLYAFSGARPAVPALRAMPWYAFLGGLYGASFVTAAAYAAPRIGVGLTLTVLVLGQLIAATAIDHFGAFGLARHPLTLERLAGVVLVAAGVILVRR